ncbi:MAG: glycosyltransferase family 2 protein [Candidatus Omnitrophota bacterium]|nr:glycosyltransferase family 2 protein [Candidatus Omnitrophota bacterium]MDZ4241301.1 glycosyltransferase family 2 protein [Candidatus Omnitrophota bacterium]
MTPMTSPSSQLKIGIIIPAHNESSAIGPLVSRIRRKDLDVIVVDDGSVDGSGDDARRNGAFVITNETRKGKGMSLQVGFQHCLRQGYAAVITMDGDGQHAVEDLDGFLEAARREPVIVVNGNRMADTRGMPLIRRWTNRFMSGLISAVCRQPIPDSQCGYRYIHREILEKLRLTSSDFEIESEVLIQASKMGYKVRSVPIRTIYSGEKSKIRPFRDTIRFFCYLLREMGRPGA